ncbi:MAG: hypothetical protein V7L29_11370 [Nostoc sp.]|uniref:hypothetical protein n=1 Tax=Nostoc sp. TaxID=1180 RepID=UPI002FFBD57B
MLCPYDRCGSQAALRASTAGTAAGDFALNSFMEKEKNVFRDALAQNTAQSRSCSAFDPCYKPLNLFMALLLTDAGLRFDQFNSCVRPTALLYETLRVACFPAGVRASYGRRWQSHRFCVNKSKFAKFLY